MYKFLVDSHCHLNYDDLHNRLNAVLDNATLQGVKFLQTISTKMSDIDEIRQIAHKYKNIYYSVGVHPLHVHETEMVSSEELVQLANNDEKISGFGETGLDYYKASDQTILHMQKDSFHKHISAAQTAGIPLIIHTREAEDDTYEILSTMMQQRYFSGVLHCFTGSMDLAKKAIDLGLYISASGIITFKNAELIRQVFRALPLDKILIETDAPFLAPVPYRGKINEPAYVVEIAKVLADIRSIALEDIIHITTENFFRLFKRVHQ